MPDSGATVGLFHVKHPTHFPTPRWRRIFNPALSVSCETVFYFGVEDEDEGLQIFAIGEVFHVEHSWAVRLILRLQFYIYHLEAIIRE
jgi:hypothetical protein